MSKLPCEVVSTALYPNGTSEASIPGPDCRIYRGWPNSAALDADLAAGKINVTIFPGGGTCHTTTRYAERWAGAAAQPTLTVAVDGTSVTFGGTANFGHVAGILVDGTSYAYRTQSGDTPQSVAANLASMARGDTIVHFVVQHTDDSRRGQSPGAGGCGRSGATGSPPPGARLSRYMLVSYTRDARRSGKRGRSGAKYPTFHRAVGWDEWQTDLCRQHGV